MISSLYSQLGKDAFDASCKRWLEFSDCWRPEKLLLAKEIKMFVFKEILQLESLYLSIWVGQE